MKHVWFYAVPHILRTSVFFLDLTNSLYMFFILTIKYLVFNVSGFPAIAELCRMR